jgi:hypothetical protein
MFMCFYNSHNKERQKFLCPINALNLQSGGAILDNWFSSAILSDVLSYSHHVPLAKWGVFPKIDHDHFPMIYSHFMDNSTLWAYSLRLIASRNTPQKIKWTAITSVDNTRVEMGSVICEVRMNFRRSFIIIH